MLLREMSFQEKRAWISLATMGLIYGRYFWSLTMQGGRGPFGSLLATVVQLVILQVVLFTLAAIFNPRDAQAKKDERERLIDLKATRVAYAGLSAGIICAYIFAGFPAPIVVRFDANSLLFVLVTAEMLRNVCQIVQYRRGVYA
jgi:uncharacterized membrane protein